VTLDAMILDSAATQLQRKLAAYNGLEHLRVRRRGKALVIYSDTLDGTGNHAKLTALGGQQWGLSLPRPTGRWERTPFVGTLDELVATLTQMLGWHLAPR
jgi:hypothetical protein